MFYINTFKNPHYQTYVFELFLSDKNLNKNRHIVRELVTYRRVIYVFVLFLGFGDGANRHLSASQLHLLLHPTDEGEDETLGNSQQIVST